LDTGDLQRLGKRVEIFNDADMTVNIENSAAVGEMIYRLLKKMEINLDRDMATCLYVAIATDTGGFRYGNTTTVTHQITADLINNGVDVSYISQTVFETVSLPKVKLMGKAIENLELFENGKLAVIKITDDLLRSVGAKEEDCEGIVNIGRNIEGVEVAVAIRERPGGELKINFRSKNYVDVSAIANRHSEKKCS